MLAGMSTSTSTFDHLGTAAAEHFDLIIIGSGSVSYTHLTLPTNREV